MIKGICDTISGLYYVNINTIPTQTMSHMDHTINQKELFKFFHAVAFIPVKYTWIKAIEKVFFIGWPGITADIVLKYLPDSPASIKGHLHQIRKNIRSTRSINSQTIDKDISCEEDRSCSNYMFTACHVTISEVKNKIYTDQTGMFPLQ